MELICGILLKTKILSERRVVRFQGTVVGMGDVQKYESKMTVVEFSS